MKRSALLFAALACAQAPAAAAVVARSQGTVFTPPADSAAVDDAEAAIREAESAVTPLANTGLLLETASAPAPASIEAHSPSSAPSPSGPPMPAPPAGLSADDDDNDDDKEDDGLRANDDDDEVAAGPAPAPAAALPSNPYGRGAGVASKDAVTAARWQEDVGEVGPDTRVLPAGSAWAKAGNVVAYRKLLTENRRHQDTLRKVNADLTDTSDFTGRVNHEVAEATAEAPKNKAVVQVLGKMWKDMRKLGAPFFLRHVEAQQQWLQKREPEIEDELDDAKADFRGLHTRKLVVEVTTPTTTEHMFKSAAAPQALPALCLALLLLARA